MAILEKYDNFKAGEIFKLAILNSSTFDEAQNSLENNLIPFINKSFMIIAKPTQLVRHLDNVGDYDYSTLQILKSIITPMPKIKISDLESCYKTKKDYGLMKTFLNKFCIVEYWFESSNRRCAYKCVFKPPPLICYDGEVNDFTKLKITNEDAEKGDINDIAVKHFINHIKRFSGKDEGLFSWIVSWLASIIQCSGEIFGTSLVVRGEQGSGKGLLFDMMQSIIGSNYCVHPASADSIFGRFNDAIDGKILMFCDELFFAGDRKIAENMKKIISEKVIDVEGKYKNTRQINNTVKVFCSSNNDWILNSESGNDRRYTVVSMDDSFINLSEDDRTKKINIMKNGIIHIAKYLYNWKIPSGTNIRKAYKTEELMNQVEQSMTGVPLFISDLIGGTVDDSVFNNSIIKPAYLYELYSKHKKFKREEINNATFYKRFSKYSKLKTYIVVEGFDKPTRCYKIPSKEILLNNLRETTKNPYLHKDMENEFKGVNEEQDDEDKVEEDKVEIIDDTDESNVEDEPVKEEEIINFKNKISPVSPPLSDEDDIYDFCLNQQITDDELEINSKNEKCKRGSHKEIVGKVTLELGKVPKLVL